MARKKDKPTFNVEQNNTESTALNTSEAQSFLQSLIQNFQQGAYCLLEALRLVKAKDKNRLLMQENKNMIDIVQPTYYRQTNISGIGDVVQIC